jgi:hypothetical protein
VIKVERAKIAAVEDALHEAVMTSTATAGLAIKHPKIPPVALAAAAMLAIQSVTMALYGADDVATPSDVHHLNISKDA